MLYKGREKLLSLANPLSNLTEVWIYLRHWSVSSSLGIFFMLGPETMEELEGDH